MPIRVKLGPIVLVPAQDTKFGSIWVYLVKFIALTKINVAKTTEKVQFQKLNTNAEKAKIPQYFCNFLRWWLKLLTLNLDVSRTSAAMVVVEFFRKLRTTWWNWNFVYDLTFESTNFSVIYFTTKYIWSIIFKEVSMHAFLDISHDWRWRFTFSSNSVKTS